MSKEFIDAIIAGDNLEAEGIFTQAMADKVGNALEVKRTELSNTFVNMQTFTILNLLNPFSYFSKINFSILLFASSKVQPCKSISAFLTLKLLVPEKSLFGKLSLLDINSCQSFLSLSDISLN